MSSGSCKEIPTEGIVGVGGRGGQNLGNFRSRNMWEVFFFFLNLNL
jgi:hypothetical protein